MLLSTREYMINTQKGETMDNKESSVYRCESCNGIMEYDVETKQMKCPNCGNCVPILNDTSKIIEHKLTIDLHYDGMYRLWRYFRDWQG